MPADGYLGAPVWACDCNSVTALFEHAAANSPDSIYCKSAAGALRYGEAARLVAALAGELSPRVRNRSVALLLPNSLSFLITYQAVLRAGGKPHLLNRGLPEASLRKLLADVAPALLIAPEEHGSITTFVVNDEALLARVADLRDDPWPGPAGAGPEDVAAILFSGGTTGLPKRVPHSHRAMMAAIERMEWGWPTRAGEVWLPVAPFTHVYGFLMGVVNPLFRSGTVVIPERFQPDLILHMLVSEKVTVFGGGPPAIYQGIMAAKGFAGTRFPDLRICPGGGAPFPVEVHRRWKEATGLTIHEGYGMTEIAPIAVNTELAGTKPGAAGKPVPDTQVEIVDLDSGQKVLPPGVAGEVRVRGPHMMAGYADDRKETAIILRDGWVYTGDIGVIDMDGFLTLTDRKKDVIFYKGFNVFPREIEEVLLTHPAVAQACVVGRPDERAGEIAVAYVTAAGGCDEAALLAHCQENLVAYKVPGIIRIEAALPLTAAGKLDRMALRARAKE